MVLTRDGDLRIVSEGMENLGDVGGTSRVGDS